VTTRRRTLGITAVALAALVGSTRVFAGTGPGPRLMSFTAWATGLDARTPAPGPAADGASATVAPHAVTAPGDPALNSHVSLAGPDEEGRPAPLSIRADIPIVYNSPSPSQVRPELIGPYQFIRSARVHEDEGTASFRLYEGHMESGESVWYILTDTDNKELADHQGLAFAAKLGFASQKFKNPKNAIRNAQIGDDGAFVFRSGRVDFTPVRQVVPGAGASVFPPKAATPGSVGDAAYTPLVRVNGVVYNAPVLAYNVSRAELARMTAGRVDYAKVHDKIVSFNVAENLVTVKLTPGYSFSKVVFYLSTDSNDPLAATLEESTLAPALAGANQDLPDHFIGQGNERLAIFINGPSGKAHPFRQGIESAMMDGRPPLNIFGGIPTINLDYSPMWDAQLIQWSKDAVTRGYRTRIIDLLHMYGLEQKGVLEGFGGGPIKRSGIIINCPVVSRLQ
jgi:hypothetical protein